MRKRIPAALLAIFLQTVPAAVSAAGFAAGENHPDARWRSLATERFRVIFPAREERVARRVLATAEEALPGLARATGGAPAGRIDIRITAWDDLSGGRSYPAWPRIELELYPLDREPERHDFLRQVTLHELTHVCHYHAFGGRLLEPVLAPAALTNIPDWWVEGLPSAAEKPAAEAREQDLVRVIARSGEVPPLHRLDDVDQGDLLDNILIYRIGESKMRWFVRRFGKDAVARVNREMRPPRWSFDGALRRATGMGEKEIHEAWLADLRTAAGVDAPAGQSIPLPRAIERPLGFAFSSREDLALVAVRDEDTYWPELYLRRAGEERIRLIDGEPVGAGLAWSPDGRFLVYARRVPGPSNEPRNDLFLYDADSGEGRRLTRGARAAEPAWTEDGRIAALAYDDSVDTVLLLAVDPGEGIEERIVVPERVGRIDRIAAGPEGTLLLTALSPEGERKAWFVDPRSESGRAFQPAAPEGAVPFEPFTAGGRARVLDYGSGGPRIVPLAVQPVTVPVETEGFAAPDRVRRPGPGPDDGIWAVVSRGRYGSAIERIDGNPGGDAGARTVPEWSGEALLGETDRSFPGARSVPARPFHPIREVRPRPEPAIESIGSESVSLRVEDLLADPTDTHRLHMSGRLRWDGALREGSLLYEIRSFTPTVRLEGNLGEEKRGAWRENTRGGSIGIELPFRFTSWATRFTLDASLARLVRKRTEAGGADTVRETLLRAGLSRRAGFPRSRTLLALRWERGVDRGSPVALPERWEAEGAWTRALFRSDAFLGFDGAIAVESGARKRITTLYPYGIERPIRAVAGTRAALGGVSFSYPWSEDLGLAVGPFYLERLTHRLRYREGIAWNEGSGGTERVRAAASELGLRLFSGIFLPFAGARTVHLTAGAAREIGEGAEMEWYFAVDADFWTERWTAGPRGAD
ncbi:MAG: PD40 domain-containing protein [Candidatus Eisenbacteria bacterium]|nr:PD40 domain-containing protein [Candidatus Eisenbacteria bacterium]